MKSFKNKSEDFKLNTNTLAMFWMMSFMLKYSFDNHRYHYNSGQARTQGVGVHPTLDPNSFSGLLRVREVGDVRWMPLLRACLENRPTILRKGKRCRNPPPPSARPL